MAELWIVQARVVAVEHAALAAAADVLPEIEQLVRLGVQEVRLRRGLKEKQMFLFMAVVVGGQVPVARSGRGLRQRELRRGRQALVVDVC